MSTLAKCPACEMGQHDQHVEHWDMAPEGVLGGAHCPCPGGCTPTDLTQWLPPARAHCDPTMEFHADPHYLCVRPPVTACRYCQRALVEGQELDWGICSACHSDGMAEHSSAVSS